MKERKKERGAPERLKQEVLREGGGHFRGQNHTRGRELRA